MSLSLGPAVSFPEHADGECVDAVTATGLGRFTGFVRGHRMHGQGKLDTPVGVFMGCFDEDALEGDGVYRAHEDGASPAGETAASVSPSLMTPILLSVRDYAGGFHHSKFDGPAGILHFKNGDAYQGPFVAGVPEGASGKYTFADGRVYVGAMQAGMRHGHGRLTETNGDYYDGEFVMNAMTGFGTASYAGGARIFSGLWEGGGKVKGRLSFPGSERVYDGQWHEDRPSGKGVMVFANGDRYEGDFDKGAMHGVGLLTYANQASGPRSYYGQFFEDRPHGRGWLLTREGEGTASTLRTVEGWFHEGQLVPPDNVDAIQQVRTLTKALPQPLSQPPWDAAAAVSLPPQHTHGEAAADGRSPAPPQTASGAETHRTEPQSGSNTGPQDATTTHRGDNSAVSSPLATGASGAVESPLRACSSSSGTVDGLDQEPDLSDADVEDGGSPNHNEDALAAASLSPGLTDGSLGSDSCKGWLEKCSIGRSKLGFISNWKRRFFILASFQGSVCLGYYDDELCRKPIGFLRLSTEDTRLVTRPSSRTHKKASKPGRELCVIYHEHRKAYKLLLRAADAADHDRWVAAFLRYFTIVDRPTDHPLPMQ